ncbi:acyltransferase family protein [Jatrophihabitans telluris]|uniref:Acyltransferase family protein n=1 Tax=Jatrophihabitans telluris TaxID=2038343 RepID=A0ABY4R0S4_9ACTN|nr:acyltransferase family protein [Jatrophihabitans telluris]UQX88755.1 acyltransferase family protein [Jatrophihabitans telluris]
MKRTDPPASAGQYTPRRFGGLDGLRALAVLAVLVFHADSNLLPGGFLGVDLFFVISGYLITRLLLGELGHTGRIRLGQFYLRRGLRLLPGLAALSVAVALAAELFWRDELLTLRDSVVSSVGYVGNWWLIDAHQSYFVASGRPPMLQHLWSLAIEEQFYLAWPLALIWMSASRRRFGWVAGIAAAGALASTLAMTVIAVRSGVPYATDSSRVYFGTDTHAMGLLLGASFGAIAERLDFQARRSWRIRPWFTDLLGLAALVALVVVVLRVDEFSERLYRGGFLGFSALAVVVVSTVTRPRSRLGRVLDMRPLRWLAARSYAIYLWHWPVVVVTRPGVDLPANRWLAVAVRIVVPMVLAAISYRVVEAPARRWGVEWLGLSAGQRRARLTMLRRGLLVPRLVGVTALAALVLLLLSSPSPSASASPSASLSPSASASASASRGSGEGGAPAARLTSLSALDLAGSPRSAAVRSDGPPASGLGSSAALSPTSAMPAAGAPTAGIAPTVGPTVDPTVDPRIGTGARAGAGRPADPWSGPAPASRSAQSGQSGQAGPSGQSGQPSVPATTPTDRTAPRAGTAAGSHGGAGSRAAPAPVAISGFGDSVMLGAAPAILSEFPHSSVQAVEGQQPYVTLRAVRDAQAGHLLASVVVIHTGNNGILRAQDLRQTLQALSDRRLVIVLTDRVSMDWQGPNNRTIDSVASGVANVRVLDWFARSNNHRDWFYDDGLHLRPAGQAGYAALLAAAAAP